MVLNVVCYFFETRCIYFCAAILVNKDEEKKRTERRWFFSVVVLQQTSRQFRYAKTSNDNILLLLRSDVPFGVALIVPRLGGNISPKTILGREHAFSSQTRKIFKLSYYQNYCSSSN